jgi:hypothetical protein
LIAWQQRKNTIKSVYVNQVRERSPIIGVKLADNRSHLRINELKHDRTTHSSRKHAKQIKTKEQLEKLNQQVQQLQYQIKKQNQAEEHLKSQVIELTTELSAANEQLRQKPVVRKRIDQEQKQRIIEMSPVEDQPLLEPAESGTIKQPPEQQAGKSIAAKKLHNRRIKQSSRVAREKTEPIKLSKENREQPLDLERLKNIADLAKRIQTRPRKNS